MKKTVLYSRLFDLWSRYTAACCRGLFFDPRFGRPIWCEVLLVGEGRIQLLPGFLGQTFDIVVPKSVPLRKVFTSGERLVFILGFECDPEMFGLCYSPVFCIQGFFIILLGFWSVRHCLSPARQNSIVMPAEPVCSIISEIHK